VKKYTCHKAILFFILAGLLASFFVSAQRHSLESANRSVEIIYEYEEMLMLAGQSGKSQEEVMRLATQF
jgi:hypothetical protein